MMEATSTAPTRRSNRSRGQVQSIYDDAKIEVERAANSAPATALKYSKKRRTKKVSPLSLPIYNLPESVLLHITSFVEDTSNVLLAVALTASSEAFRESNWKIKPCAAARTILNQQIEGFCQHIDFKKANQVLAYHLTDRAIWEVQDCTKEALTSRLTDEDIGGILTCVGDIFEVTDVNLMHCINVSGCCLEPLRGSSKLRQLDLSLVDSTYTYENYNIPSNLSQLEIIPILDSILDADGCSLTHIKFPKKWRVEHSQMLGRFLSKYNRLMNRKNITCGNGGCEGICRGTARHPWISKKGVNFGTYNFTCFSCKQSFCGECVQDFFPDEPCPKCQVSYCNSCFDTLLCDGCLEVCCQGCNDIHTCELCNKTLCQDCGPVMSCECCLRTKCNDCTPFLFCEHPNCLMENPNCCECGDAHPERINFCDECETTFCAKHLVNYVANNPDQCCSECESRAALNLADSNKEFGNWVVVLENKYSTKGRDCWTAGPSEDFKHGMKVRDELRERCGAVGMLLLPKQKVFERFDGLLEQYDSILKL